MAPTETIVLYGDFNCPFSAVASQRCQRLVEAGRISVDWRAVQHAPDLPEFGRELTDKLRDELEEELATIRALLTSLDDDRLRLPARQANTRLATQAYAGVSEEDRAEFRESVFAAHWSAKADISDPVLLSELGAAQPDAAVSERWQRGWAALHEPMVPSMVMPDGYLSRGLGALERLATLELTLPRA